MTVLAWLAAAVAGPVVAAVAGALISEEIRARFDKAPLALLRRAARRLRLPADQREEILQLQWEPELVHVLRGDEAMPLTRLWHGARFATGLWLAAPRISRELDPSQASGVRDRLRRGWDSFLNMAPSYASLLTSWCGFSCLAGGLIWVPGTWSHLIVLGVWGVLWNLLLLNRRRAGKRAGQQGPDFEPTDREVAFFVLFIVPALTVAGAVSGSVSLMALLTGHGSAGAWAGLVWPLVATGRPWAHLRDVSRLYLAECAEAGCTPVGGITGLFIWTARLPKVIPSPPARRTGRVAQASPVDPEPTDAQRS